MLNGGAAILYSLFTDYELGVIKRVPVKAHLTLDAVFGLLLAASPWLLGFAETTWRPHLALGLFEVAAALLTRHHPSYGSARRAG